jgi:8-oxo-dGTP diphosphatase
MAARISGFEPRRPDRDGGRAYRRLLYPLAGAADVLGWGEPAVAQARAAGRVAASRWNIDIDAASGVT